MIRFSEKDQDRQFISVHILDGTPAAVVLSELKGKYPTLENAEVILLDWGIDEEILIEIGENAGFGFSLCAFRNSVEELAQAEVKIFSVDLDAEGQRYG